MKGYCNRTLSNPFPVIREKKKKKRKREKKEKEGKSAPNKGENQKVELGVDPDFCLSGGTESEGITLDNRSFFFS